jgi:hypothetical protein
LATQILTTILPRRFAYVAAWCFLFDPVAHAQELPLTPIDAEAETTNGTVWTLDPTETALNSARFDNGLQRRAVLEFPLGAIPATATLRAARLELELASLTSSSGSYPIIEFHGYAGDGVLTVPDATRPSNPIGLSQPIMSLSDEPIIYLDAEYIESLLGVATHLGIYTYQVTPNRQVEFYSTEAAQMFPVSAARLVLELAGPLAHGNVMFMSDRSDYVWDPHRNMMYVTMLDGSVERFDFASRKFLHSWRVGESLLGADITPDGDYLYAADVPDELERPQIRKIDLETGEYSTLSFEPAFSEGRVWDIKIGANGIGLSSTAFNGSGWVPLRELDVATDAISIRMDYPDIDSEVTGKSLLRRSLDRSTIFLLEGNISSGPVTVYDAASDSFVDHVNTNSFNIMAAAAPDGGALARMSAGTTELRDRSLDVLGVIGSQAATVNGGVVFDPVRPLLYVCDVRSDRIIAFHTESRTERFRFPIGESISSVAAFEVGSMGISDHGRFILASTPFGIRYYELFFLNESLIDDLADCMEGPGLAPSPTQGLPGDSLRRFDGDADGDVDLGDIAMLMRTFE